MNRVELIDQTTSVNCQNDDCSVNGQPGSHIRRYGKTRKGIQRYQCKVCKSTFTQTKGSFFYNLHTPAEVVIECLAMVANYQTMSSIRRKMGIKEDTLISWMRQATGHVEEVESLLMSECDMSRTQMNQFWILVSRYC
ncbi:MAG: IS1 family transposase [Chloroflexi bacterium]|nr:MAG: IS1 family transposase [Chloroflexota bacterium]